MSVDPNLGRKLSNRYELIEVLGKGSMGQVYGAKDTLLGGVFVAVKFLSHALINQKMLDRFEREATTCAMLGQRSIHIVRVTDYGVDDHGVPYYIMEYLKGSALIELIREGPIPIPRFLGLVRQICLGLRCAHNGININGETYPIIHRDIKPSNIFVTRDDSFGELVKILDFGIAKTLQEEADQTNCFMGTLAYASPEQMEGLELDGRSDIYSLGIMMFQMLTGKMPLNADTHTFGSWYKTHREQTPRSVVEAAGGLMRLAGSDKARDEVKRALKAIDPIIMSCLEKDPDKRPQSAVEIIESFKVLEGRFGTGRELGYRISSALNKTPVIAKPSSQSPEDICRLQSWPKDKPIADIVFPHILRTSSQSLLTLWVMLPKASIDELMDYTAHNKFMFLESPHPVLLWVTVLYSLEHGPRWFPCYLDLKRKFDQRMLDLLIEAKHYRVLLFAREFPQACSRVLTLTITEPSTRVSADLVNDQANLLKQFAVLAQGAPTTQPHLSKSFLKEELEKIKPSIVRRLEAIR